MLRIHVVFFLLLPLPCFSILHSNGISISHLLSAHLHGLISHVRLMEDQRGPCHSLAWAIGPHSGYCFSLLIGSCSPVCLNALHFLLDHVVFSTHHFSPHIPQPLSPALLLWPLLCLSTFHGCAQVLRGM